MVTGLLVWRPTVTVIVPVASGDGKRTLIRSSPLNGGAGPE